MSDYETQISELKKKLDPKFVKDPPQGKFGQYIEGWHAIAEANRIFGHDGWAYDVVSVTQTNAEQDGQKHRIGYMAHVKVNAMGTVRGDVGHGQGFGKSLGDAHDSAVKEAVTDALKRALRTFGNPFGLALYDKTQANVGVDATEAELDSVTENINSCQTMDELQKFWIALAANHKHIAAHKDIIAAKDNRKSEIQERSQ